MKVIAVIVTYNRLPLLKECVAAVKSQTHMPDEIIVVNNSSTDGTDKWLAGQTLTVITQPNRGGSWGFYTGIKSAYEKGADWIWLMDDDTIPQSTALKALLKPAIHINNTGFLSSKAVWTDGNPHNMNIPEIGPVVNGLWFNQYDEWGAQLVKSSTFVSLLLSREAVKKAGLPLKEFFIWTDDHEYTDRIIRSGMLGFYVAGSVVVHKTPANHGSNIFKDQPKDVWKYRYGIRNELYYLRQRKGNFKFWRLIFKRLFVFPFRLLRKRKNARWLFIKTVWQAALSAITFHPRVDYVTDSNQA